MARVPVALTARLTLPFQGRPGEAQRRERGGVQKELMPRAVPDDDWPGAADCVQLLAGDWSVPELVVSPGEEEFLGVGERGVGLAQPREVFVAGRGRLDCPAGQIPVLDRDHLDREAE